MQPLQFRTIDLGKHAGLCVEFRRDAFACSFADGAARFEAESGEHGERYLDWLRQRIAELPEGCMHAWDADRIIGQIEMRLRADGRGYINLFYLTANARGCGAGDQLHDYAVHVLRQRAVTSTRLSVNLANVRAVAYYRKHGWVDCGPRPNTPDVNTFELAIT